MEGRARRSHSSAVHYNVDEGDSDFEKDLGDQSPKVSPTAGTLKRKRDSKSPARSRSRRSGLRNGHRQDHDHPDAVHQEGGVPSRARTDYSPDDGKAQEAFLLQSGDTKCIVKLQLKPTNATQGSLISSGQQGVNAPKLGQDNSNAARLPRLDHTEKSSPESDVRSRRNGHQRSVRGYHEATNENGEDEEEGTGVRTRRMLRSAKQISLESDSEPGAALPVASRSDLQKRKLPARRDLARSDPDEDEYIENTDEDDQDPMSDISSTPERDDIHDFVEDDDPISKTRRKHPARQAARTRSRRIGSRPRRKTTSHMKNGRGSDSDFTSEGNHDELQAELQEIRPPIREERRRQLRDRTNRPDYAIPPPLTEQMIPTSAPRQRDPVLRSSFRSLYPQYDSLGLGVSANAHQTFGNFGPPVGLQSDSDSSEEEGQIHPSGPRLANGTSLPILHPRKQSAAGGAKEIGLVKGANLADADPLEIGQEVNFDSVGGLADHVNQLKEMVNLPLLYPEIFQRFHITPPRGVLFHGPPGTGKTLMARALAASCSSEGKKISFYMRKGADCLSKWVGEAERQLRLLFEEAGKNQPSIIFFDEIDGLAPVRSAKQDQIHASIVSTLLALMDGMDARGQVVVIGATNRPDSVDPALRRPGRFDREFYFPLPSLEARNHILKIHTNKWQPPLEEDFISQLATQTKGYGGADLRALCTEAALNAVQRRYPQIYQSSEKLIIEPETIGVSPRDFMAAIKKIVPSSARASASSAAVLPEHIQPLLRVTLERAKCLVDCLVPRGSKATALEDNMLYTQGESTFQTEQLGQMLDRIRTFRPRLLISGAPGLGQQHIGRAILHHLEGFHVQTLDLATMFGDSASTPEASLLQAFVEAKRHKPSVLYIPFLELWFQSASLTVVTILKTMLSSLDGNDQLVLLGIATSPLSELSHDIVELFGRTERSNFVLRQPDANERYEFFAFLVSIISKSPADLPDSSQRKLRTVEKLPKAPPAPPRKMSKAERKLIEAKDRKTKLFLKAKLGPLMELIRGRYKRFKKPTIDEKDIAHLLLEPGAEIPDTLGDRDYEKTEDGMILEKSTGKRFYNMDINLIEERLWSNLYLTPKQFQNDIEQILHDSQQEDGDRERILKAKELHTNVLIHLEDMFDSTFLEECKSMALREVQRHRLFTERTTGAVVAETVNQNATSTTLAQEDVTEIIDSERMDGFRTDEQLENVPQTTSMHKARTEVANPPAEAVKALPQPHPTEDTVTRDVVMREDENVEREEVLAQSHKTDVARSDMSLSTILHSPARPPPAGDIVLSDNAQNGTLPDTASHAGYQLDKSQLESLHSIWVSATADLNVDQLEQILSIAIDTIWQCRANWNRTEVADVAHQAVLQALKSLDL